MAEVTRKSRSQKPAGTRGRTPQRIASKAAAQDQLIRYVSAGQTIQAGLDKIGRSRKTYELWRREDEEFVRRIDAAKQAAGAASARGKESAREWMPFETWRKRFLNRDTFWHQRQWIDILEGRDPRDLHPSQTYIKGEPNKVLITVPPNHAKSATLTEYVAYRICMDPSYRVLIISAGSDLAQAFLFSVKQILTNPDYLELHKAYGPDGGFEQSAESWTESRITFSQAHRSSGSRGSHEKDPNVLALGMRSKVYGRRADLAIVDDSVDTNNASEYQKQMRWLNREVLTRIEAGGRTVMLGTRIASIDLYSEIMKGENFGSGVSPWTHFASPAILEEHPSDPTQHVTLWPFSSEPWVSEADRSIGIVCGCGKTETCAEGFDVDGERRYPRWDGLHLEKIPRASMSAGEWALVFQQASIPEDATFPEMYVTKAINGLRLCGRLEAGRSGHHATGMHGKYVIAGLDPSIKGFAGMTVCAVDRDTQKRYLLNAWNLRAPTKDELVAKMQQVTEHYAVDEWRVEKTGLLQFFTQDSQMRAWFATRGVRFTEHQTGSNKWDPSFGISSMAALFGEYEKLPEGAIRADNFGYKTIIEPLIELPRPNQDGVKALIHQLVTWTPDLDPKKVPQDMLMAMWFMECGARQYLGYGAGTGAAKAFTRSQRFVTGSRRTTVVNIAAYR